MDERINFYAIELTVSEDSDLIEVLDELIEHLKNNGYRFFISYNPYLEQIPVLLIYEEQTGYIDTILQDRNIEYNYVTV